MLDICELVKRASSDDRRQQHAAFDELVCRLQDMAYGYAFSILRDFHLAEDVAQEAFVEAYLRLDQLREPAAFPAWLRRIVHSKAHRELRRRMAGPAVRSEAGPAPSGPTPAEITERAETKDQVLQAVMSLPEDQRAATSLFYIDGYSQGDIAGFLEVPVSVVTGRLRRARDRLREEMPDMIKEGFDRHALPDDFRTRTLAEAFRAGDVGRIFLGVLPDREQLLALPAEERPPGSEGLFELLEKEDDWVAVIKGGMGSADAIALLGLIPAKEKLLATVMKLTEQHPKIAKARAKGTGFTLLHMVALASVPAEQARVQRLVKLLMSLGAKVDAKDKGGNTPLHHAVRIGNAAAVTVLLECGASLEAKNKAENTPLIVAASVGKVEAMKILLARGADIEARTTHSATALHAAAYHNQPAAVELLLEAGADSHATLKQGMTPRTLAEQEGNRAVTALLPDGQ